MLFSLKYCGPGKISTSGRLCPPVPCRGAVDSGGIVGGEPGRETASLSENGRDDEVRDQLSHRKTWAASGAGLGVDGRGDLLGRLVNMD